MAGQDPRLRGEPLKHVLVIDDDVAMRHLIVEYLTIHAFKVTAVADSKQFNRVLCSETVDVVVVDLNLGREDGLEIVRSLATKSDVPIIIISGARLEEADKVIALELGATDFIAKPFWDAGISGAHPCCVTRAAQCRANQRSTLI